MRLLLHILAVTALWSTASITLAGEEKLVSENNNAVIQIEAGRFVMGSNAQEINFAVELCKSKGGSSQECAPDRFSDESPARQVYLPRYEIDRTEVSRKAYRRCVLSNVCAPSRIADNDQNLGKPELPVTGITWDEARDYCLWLGGDLPMEAQWERAARVVENRVFPWGRGFDDRLANHGSGQGKTDASDGYTYAAPVEAFEKGKSANGLVNLAGNVWEFTRDSYGAADNAVGAAQLKQRVIRGGSWLSPIYTLRTSARSKVGAGESRPDVGFRCVYHGPLQGI